MVLNFEGYFWKLNFAWLIWFTCDHWKESYNYQRCASQFGFEEIAVDYHDKATNTIKSIHDSSDHCILRKDVEKVVAYIERFGDVLEAL